MKLSEFLFAIYLVWVSNIALAENPYVGQQTRELKSLSSNEIEGYLTGKGMGLAKVAELNNYPGPRHVLELSNELKLTSKQIQETNEIYETMHKQVTGLGQSFIEIEKEIESKFRSGLARSNETRNLLLKSSSILGEIRFHHINAHLKQKEVMTKEQVNLYNKLRGYGEHGHHMHKHHH